VVDDGDFDCNGDGAPDPNIIRNAWASLNGQSLGPRENGAPLVINGITLQ